MGENIDLRELFFSYAKHWKWFAISAVLGLVLAFLYLRYTTPEYIAEAKIQIEEDKDTASGLDLFKELDVFSGAKNKVEDEIEIINSRSNLIEVVKALGLNTTITVLGDIRDTEIYQNPPINVNYIAPDSTLNKTDYTFYFTYR